MSDMNCDVNVRQAKNGFVVTIYKEETTETFVCGSFAQVKKLLTNTFASKEEKAEE